MKTGLIVFGVIFLVLGAVLYFIPTQTAGASTTTITEQGRDTARSYASVQVPWALSVAMIIIGFLLLVLGIIPRDKVIVKEQVSTPSTVKEREEKTEINGNVKKRTIREREEQIVEE